MAFDNLEILMRLNFIFLELSIITNFKTNDFITPQLLRPKFKPICNYYSLHETPHSKVIITPHVCYSRFFITLKNFLAVLYLQTILRGCKMVCVISMKWFVQSLL